MTETAPARHANAHPVFARILNSIFDVATAANAPDDIDDREALDAQEQKQAAKEERIRTYGVPGSDLGTPADVLRFVERNVFESE